METRCRLCGSAAVLCRSHILPEFLYRPLYDEKHRYSVVTKGVRRSRFVQKGLSERLLCLTCEGRLGVFESYAAKVMTGQLGHRAERHGGRLTIRGIDYRRFKLFQLSILWRASVSGLDFFRLVSLGAREAKAREMLLAGDAGSPEDFGCVVVFSHDRGADVSDTMFNPEPLRWGGRRMCKFFFAGAVWLYHCDRRRAASHLQKFFLSEQGELTGLVGDLDEGRTLGHAAKRLARRAGFV